MNRIETLEWLVANFDRYNRINAARDDGLSVTSSEKEFVAKFDRRRAAIHLTTRT